MRIAYFTNQYPKVSHSFIRREIQSLEQLGYDISRFAIRGEPSELVDPLDKDEYQITRYITDLPKWSIIKLITKLLIDRPKRFINTLFFALNLGYRSERGLINHIFYFVEACILLNWQKETKVEHIHVHFGTNPATIAMLAKCLGGVGYSFTVHGPEEFDKPKFIALQQKIEQSRFVVAISSYGKSQLMRWVASNHWNKIKVVHCALEQTFFEQAKMQEPVKTKQLVCVGRLCEQKGQLLLLRAAKRLFDKDVDFKLILAGDGPMRAEIEHQISRDGLENHVEITGWISSQQVKSLLTESRGLVLPSFAEGLPVVIMESLALYRPVISTYIAGIPELIRPGENGWLIPAGDLDALVVALEQMLNLEATVHNAMGKHGHEAVSNRHHGPTEAKKLAHHIQQSLTD